MYLDQVQTQRETHTPVSVVPVAVETQHLSVIIQKLTKGVKLLIWPQWLHGCTALFPEARVGVLRNADGSWHTDTTLVKEVAGKLITAHDLKGPPMQDDLLVNVEVLHSIVAVIVGKGEGDAMAADQCALRYP